MEFEFDPAKSAANKYKHGIDFVEAQALWYGRASYIIEARHDGELRYALIGKIDGKVWTAIHTIRDGVFRIISVRRGREAEVRYYEAQDH